MQAALTFYEFFAGAGMTRLALGDGWRCLFANGIDPVKGTAYAANFAPDHLRVCDVAALTVDDLPREAVDPCWMSPPCVGRSEAGDKAGFDEEESRAFWPAWELVEALVAAGRAPKTIAFENVVGIKPENLAAVQAAFGHGGYGHATPWSMRGIGRHNRASVVIVTVAHESLGVDPEPLFERAMRALPKRRVELVDVLDLDAKQCCGNIRP
jgi:site-specific DNA-cytosine methylase